MKRTLAHLIVPAIVLTLAWATKAASLGDPAAPLEIAEWIKGEPVDLAAVKGKKIVVVEFWATWCGPCLTSIPHLTEMQKKFASRGVVFIGVSDESAAKVKPFVDKMGEKMDYTVALDRDRKTSEGYMKAYGANGIPHAFIVDKEGRIAWQGHPMAGLDKALERMAANTFDLGAEKKRDAAQRKLEEYFELASTDGNEAQLEKLGAQLLALDKELGGILPDEKLDLDHAAEERAFPKHHARLPARPRERPQRFRAGESRTEGNTSRAAGIQVLRVQGTVSAPAPVPGILPGAHPLRQRNEDRGPGEEAGRRRIEQRRDAE
jgi:thiol-disulfide isomerase/thioredoxin